MWQQSSKALKTQHNCNAFHGGNPGSIPGRVTKKRCTFVRRFSFLPWRRAASGLPCPSPNRWRPCSRRPGCSIPTVSPPRAPRRSETGRWLFAPFRKTLSPIKRNKTQEQRGVCRAVPVFLFVHSYLFSMLPMWFS